jgi:hypothetical protein
VDELGIEALYRQRGQPSNRGQPAQRGRGRGPTGTARQVPTCYYCDKRGHMQKDCFKRQREKGALKPAPRGSVHPVDEEAPLEGPDQPNEPPPAQFVDLNSLSAYLNW